MKKYRFLYYLSISCILFIFIINQEEPNFNYFILVYIVGILILSIFNYKYVLVLYLALYPIASHYLVIYRSTFDISFNRVFIFIIVIGYVHFKKKIKKVKSAKLNYLLYALTFLDVVTSVGARSGLLNNLNTSISFYFEVVLIAVIYYNVFDNSDLSTLIFSLSIGVFFLSICGILERYSDLNLLFSFPTASDIYSVYQVSYDSLRDDVKRIRGPFMGAVQYSGFGPLMLLCSLYVFNKKKVIGIIFLIIVTTCLFFCVSRTAIYLFAIYFLIYFSMTKQKKTIIIGFTWLFVFFIVLFPMEIYRAIDMGLNPFEYAYSGGNTEGRLALIKEGMGTIIFGNPFGLGGGADLQNLIMGNLILMDMCNFFIGYGISKGIFYILFFIYLICFLLWKLFWLAKNTSDETAKLFFVSFLSTFIGLLSYAEITITLPIILILYLVLTKNVSNLSDA